MKTTELGLLLQVLPVHIIAFVETLGSHLERTLNSAPGSLLTYHSYQLEVSKNAKNVPTFYSNSAIQFKCH